MADTDYMDLLADQVVVEAVNDSAGYITATVIVVNDDATVDVRVGDGAPALLSEEDVIETGQVIAGVAYPAWLRPVVGMLVWLVQQGSWTVIVGSPAQEGAPVPGDHGHVIGDTAGLQAALDGKADDGTVVHKAGAETITGVKTFDLSPLVPDGRTDSQAVNFGQLEAVQVQINAMQTDVMCVGYYNASLSKLVWLSQWGRDRRRADGTPVYEIDKPLPPVADLNIPLGVDGYPKHQEYVLVVAEGPIFKTTVDDTYTANYEAAYGVSTPGWGTEATVNGVVVSVSPPGAFGGAMLSWPTDANDPGKIRVGDWLIALPEPNKSRAFVDGSWGLFAYSARSVVAKNVAFTPTQGGVLDNSDNVQDALEALDNALGEADYGYADTPTLLVDEGFTSTDPPTIPTQNLREGTVAVVGAYPRCRWVSTLHPHPGDTTTPAPTVEIPIPPANQYWQRLNCSYVQFRVETYGVLSLRGTFNTILTAGTSGSALGRLEVRRSDGTAVTSVDGGYGFFRVGPGMNVTGHTSWMGALNPGTYTIIPMGYRGSGITVATFDRLFVEFDFEPGALWADTGVDDPATLEGSM